MLKNNNRDNVELAWQILTEYGDYISTVILTRVQNEEQASDIFQDFFLSLVSKPVPANVKNIKNYLYKAIINDISDNHRRVQSYKANIQKYSENIDFPINNIDLRNALIEEEQREKMFEAIRDLLPISSSRAITGRYRDNQSLEEVAETMGVKKTTVSRYLSLGMDKIRQIFR